MPKLVSSNLFFQILCNMASIVTSQNGGATYATASSQIHPLNPQPTTSSLTLLSHRNTAATRQSNSTLCDEDHWTRGLAMTLLLRPQLEWAWPEDSRTVYADQITLSVKPVADTMLLLIKDQCDWTRYVRCIVGSVTRGQREFISNACTFVIQFCKIFSK